MYQWACNNGSRICSYGHCPTSSNIQSCKFALVESMNKCNFNFGTPKFELLKVWSVISLNLSSLFIQVLLSILCVYVVLGCCAIIDVHFAIWML